MILGFLLLRFQVKNLVIVEDLNLNLFQLFICAEELNVLVDLLPLLSGNLRVRSVELRRPAVELIRTKQGSWNFATLGTKTATSPTTAQPSSAGKGFSLDNLAIVDGQVGITDLQQKGARSAYDHIDLTLINYTT